MEELGYILFFLLVWFVVPFLIGTLLFKFLKKRWKALSKEKGLVRFFNYGVFLICALVGWFFEMLVLTGIKMVL